MTQDSNSGLIFENGVTICENAVLQGEFEIKICSGSVLSPSCKVLSTVGPIVIGKDCILEDNVIVENLNTQPMEIGKRNLFQVGSVVRCNKVGDFNIFEIKSSVGPNIKSIGSGCVVGTAVSLDGNSDVESDIKDSNVVFRLDDKVCIKKRKNVKEDNNLTIAHYLESLRNENSRSALCRNHKLRSIE